MVSMIFFMLGILFIWVFYYRRPFLCHVCNRGEYMHDGCGIRMNGGNFPENTWSIFDYGNSLGAPT